MALHYVSVDFSDIFSFVDPRKRNKVERPSNKVQENNSNLAAVKRRRSLNICLYLRDKLRKRPRFQAKSLLAHKLAKLPRSSRNASLEQQAKQDPEAKKRESNWSLDHAIRQSGDRVGAHRSNSTTKMNRSNTTLSTYLEDTCLEKLSSIFDENIFELPFNARHGKIAKVEAHENTPAREASLIDADITANSTECSVYTHASRIPPDRSSSISDEEFFCNLSNPSMPSPFASHRARRYSVVNDISYHAVQASDIARRTPRLSTPEHLGSQASTDEAILKASERTLRRRDSKILPKLRLSEHLNSDPGRVSISQYDINQRTKEPRPKLPRKSVARSVTALDARASCCHCMCHQDLWLCDLPRAPSARPSFYEEFRPPHRPDSVKTSSSTVEVGPRRTKSNLALHSAGAATSKSRLPVARARTLDSYNSTGGNNAYSENSPHPGSQSLARETISSKLKSTTRHRAPASFR